MLKAEADAAMEPARPFTRSRTMFEKKCKMLNEVPPVASEGQLNVQCPDCKFYGPHCECSNPVDRCPFDGKRLPLREATPEPIESVPA